MDPLPNDILVAVILAFMFGASGLALLCYLVLEEVERHRRKRMQK